MPNENDQPQQPKTIRWHGGGVLTTSGQARHQIQKVLGGRLTTSGETSGTASHHFGPFAYTVPPTIPETVHKSGYWPSREALLEYAAARVGWLLRREDQNPLDSASDTATALGTSTRTLRRWRKDLGNWTWPQFKREVMQEILRKFVEFAQEWPLLAAMEQEGSGKLDRRKVT